MRIESQQEAFFTLGQRSGSRADVGVVREAGKLPYLRTHVDGKWNHNLRAQPERGASCKVVGYAKGPVTQE